MAPEVSRNQLSIKPSISELSCGARILRPLEHIIWIRYLCESSSHDGVFVRPFLGTYHSIPIADV
jgi:hypothetical protein